MSFYRQLEKTLQLIENNISSFKKENRNIYASSSFQTQSVPLLHILGEHFPQVKIIFLDTGFLFPETYAFKEQLERIFNLDIITLKSNTSLIQQRDNRTGLFQYALDPDYCCYINKVSPLDDFLQSGDIWISGVRRDQTSVRKEMKTLEYKEHGIVKLHPMLEWNSRDIYQYIQKNNLPKHPLEKEGFISIGCVPCTYKWTDGTERGGRWVGSKKTECGLHSNK